jgi:hypothetical protein
VRVRCFPALENNSHFFEAPLRPPSHAARGPIGSPDGERRDSGKSCRFFLTRDVTDFLAALGKL